MFRKEIITLVLTALGVFALVASAASLAIRAVERDAKLVAQDTLPGLVNAGEAINRSSENWFNTSQLLNPATPQSRADLIAKINANSTDAFWDRYSQSIFGQQDEETFKAMQKNRMEFVELRKRFFDLVASEKMDAARQLYEAQLKPVFQKYRDTSLDLFRYNANLGQNRADRIIHFSQWTPFALAAFCVVVLLTGVFVGFKASLGAFSGNWSEGIKKKS